MSMMSSYTLGFCYRHAIYQEGWWSPLIYFTVKCLLIILRFFHRHSTVTGAGGKKKRRRDTSACRGRDTMRMISHLFQWMNCNRAFRQTHTHNAPAVLNQGQSLHYVKGKVKFVFCTKVTRTKRWESWIAKIRVFVKALLCINNVHKKSVSVFQAVMNIKLNSQRSERKSRKKEKELMSEAEHRIKKFDDIHAQEETQLIGGK